jgi:hypothetical protein
MFLHLNYLKKDMKNTSTYEEKALNIELDPYVRDTFFR